jgi:hypothetical protein
MNIPELNTSLRHYIQTGSGTYSVNIRDAFPGDEEAER